MVIIYRIVKNEAAIQMKSSLSPKVFISFRSSYFCLQNGLRRGEVLTAASEFLEADIE